jgi:uncharacterized protein YjiS (DUF1127 family)
LCPIGRQTKSALPGDGSTRPANGKPNEMSVYETTPRPLPLGTMTTHRVVSAIEQILTTLVAWRRARLTETTLNNLSDAQLADIGVRRGQISAMADRLARR